MRVHRSVVRARAGAIWLLSFEAKVISYLTVVGYPHSCGYATVHNVLDMSLEDRMESFFLSETCKYLFLVSAALFECAVR